MNKEIDLLQRQSRSRGSQVIVSIVPASRLDDSCNIVSFQVSLSSTVYQYSTNMYVMFTSLFYRAIKNYQLQYIILGVDKGFNEGMWCSLPDTLTTRTPIAPPLHFGIPKFLNTVSISKYLFYPLVWFPFAVSELSRVVACLFPR